MRNFHSSSRNPDIVRVSRTMHRRDALLGALSLCCLPALARTVVEAPAPLFTERVADGIYFRRGADADASAANEGGIANVGFVEGRDAVAIFDPGGSFIDGQRLRQAVRMRTGKPIRYVILSHGHPDHVFGAAGFAHDSPKF